MVSKLVQFIDIFISQSRLLQLMYDKNKIIKIQRLPGVKTQPKLVYSYSVRNIKVYKEKQFLFTILQPVSITYGENHRFTRPNKCIDIYSYNNQLKYSVLEGDFKLTFRRVISLVLFRAMNLGPRPQTGLMYPPPRGKNFIPRGSTLVAGNQHH